MFIRWKELQELTGLSRSTVLRWEEAGKFPKRKKLGPRVIAWSREEVETWIAARSEK